MPAVAPIHILWDSAHIWGLMAWRAVRVLGLPCRLVKGQEIAEGAFLRKPGPGEAALLLVPGGNARLKAQALGPDGLETVRRWVAQGGRYLGFCGGAGLALRHENAAAGLNLCPWMRAAYPQRLHHLISGHVRVRLRADDPRVPPELTAGQAADAALPVWWPGRFAPEAGEDVRVLAAYDAPGEDFWLADLPYAPQKALVPLWQLRAPCAAWPAESGAPLLRALNHVRGLLDLAVEHHLFFARTHWLWGWRAGQPGAACNNLHAALCTAAGLPPSAAALAYWREVGPRFTALEDLFTAGAEGYFLACRLADTLASTLPEAVGRRGLEHQREALFGHPMNGGGLLEELLTIAEELTYLSQGGIPCGI